MSFSMIFAVVIMFISCLLILFFVSSIASNVMKKMKKEVFQYIKIYNDYMEKDLNSLENEEICLTTSSLNTSDTASESIYEANLAIPFIPKNQPMQKNDFAHDYLKIRTAFHQDAVAVINQMTSKEEKTSKDEYDTISKILSKLTFDNVYKIACLQPDDQMSLLKDIFDESENELLDDYNSCLRESFDCIEFCSYLKIKKAELDRHIYVYVREDDPIDLLYQYDTDVTICKDQHICEGFQIIQGNYLYDYGIRNSEII